MTASIKVNVNKDKIISLIDHRLNTIEKKYPYVLDNSLNYIDDRIWWEDLTDRLNNYTNWIKEKQGIPYERNQGNSYTKNSYTEENVESSKIDWYKRRDVVQHYQKLLNISRTIEIGYTDIFELTDELVAIIFKDV